MNKEFRVWDAYQRKMSYGGKNKDLTIAFTNGKLSEVSLDDNENSCGWSAVPIDLERANRYFAQQYTGLTDSTGKKIFEGDIIVESNAKYDKTAYEIKYCRHSYSKILAFHPVSKSNNHLNYYYGEWSGEQVTIIGNIFETPELLK